MPRKGGSFEAKLIAGWIEKNKNKDARRAENRAKWAERRDWSDDHQVKLLNLDSPVAAKPGESRSLARLRSIMANPDVPLYRRLDAAELVLSYELAPGALAGADPDQVAAQSYQFLNAATDNPETPEALRFRALKAIAAVENARTTLRQSAESFDLKRELLLSLANAERQRNLRSASAWPASHDWEIKNDPPWPPDWPGLWQWPPTSFAALLSSSAETLRQELSGK